MIARAHEERAVTAKHITDRRGRVHGSAHPTARWDAGASVDRIRRHLRAALLSVLRCEHMDSSLLPVPVGDIPTHLVPHGVTFRGSRVDVLDRAPELLRGGTQGVVIWSNIMGSIRKSRGEGAE